MGGFFLQVVLFWFCRNIGLSDSFELSNYFVTSPYYANYRIYNSEPNVFKHQHIKKGMSLPWATMTCGSLCNNNDACLAFNIYEMDDNYVCELLSAHLCRNISGLVLVDWPGSSIWDKLTLGNSVSCFETKFPTMSAIPCSDLKPGCLGIWPNCSNCVRNCIECQERYSYSGDRECIFWPQGDATYSIPIFGRCSSSATYLIRRAVDTGSATVKVNYLMSFADMNRVIQLGVYTKLKFLFSNKLGSYVALYRNPYIDAQGTLSNLTFQSSTPSILNYDFLELHGNVLTPKPFVSVADDRFSCGSFWLFDINNATYCPGGKIGMLGTPKKITVFGLPFVYTGIRIGDTLHESADMILVP